MTVISVLVPHAFTCVLRVQSQVDEVIDVMQENISKVIERGERLDDLQDKSGESHAPGRRVLLHACVNTHAHMEHFITPLCLVSTSSSLMVYTWHWGVIVLAVCGS